MSAPGDSGGPTIKRGLVQGITSYGMTIVINGITADITPDIVDSSVGEFGGDTYVAIYVGWIDSVTGGNVPCKPAQQRRGLC